MKKLKPQELIPNTEYCIMDGPCRGKFLGIEGNVAVFENGAGLDVYATDSKGRVGFAFEFTKEFSIYFTEIPSNNE